MTDLPEEGKVVAVLPDTPEQARNLLAKAGLPVIVSDAVPEGIVFVIDLDVIHGRPSQAERAAEQFERVKKLLETPAYRNRFGLVTAVDGAHDSLSSPVLL